MLISSRQAAICSAFISLSAGFTRAETAPVKTGAFETTFAERAPESRPGVLKKTVKPVLPKIEEFRRKWADAKDYDLASEKFQVYVPAAYRATKPAGLMVWCSSNDSGAVPTGWRAVADAHNLIIVGADGVGNSRPCGFDRIGLALDGMYNIRKTYSIDASRVIFAGFSGGGAIAYAGNVYFPGLSGGCIQIGGAEVPKPTGSFTPAWTISPALFAGMKTRSRYLFICGEKDKLWNAGTVGPFVDKGYAQWGFKKRCFYIPVAGLGHALPDSGVMEKAIGAFEGAYDTQKDNRIP